MVPPKGSGERGEPCTRLASPLRPKGQSRAGVWEAAAQLERSCGDSKALGRAGRCPIYLQQALRGDPQDGARAGRGERAKGLGPPAP